MPYTGKPSYGCAMCKKRHKKCDEGKPNCIKCVKSGLRCPGYRSELDIVLRNQNKTAQEASLKRQQRALAKREQSGNSNLLAADNLSFFRTMPSAEPINSSETAFYFTTSFQDTVALQRANCPGYMELLPFMYSMTASNSALAYATQTLASCFRGAWIGAGGERDTENRTSQLMLGKALLATQQAISDPTKSKSDETLMAALILCLCETITSVYRHQPGSSGRHETGAIALVKHRGAENFKTELGRRMTTAVRSHAIHLGAACEDLWVKSADLHSDPAALLDSLIQESCSIPDSTGKDIHVATWTNLIPESWRPICIEADDPDFHSYSGFCAIYPHLGVMNLYNRWRSARIAILSNDNTHDLQKLVDEICASVPFGLGNRNRSGPIYQPGWKYPHLEGESTSDEHYRVACTLGGFHLARPLMQILRLKVRLRDGQREWVGGQLGRIARLYEMK